jgi:putative transposase
MSRAYQRKTTSVFLLNYHLIWIPKYRRKVLVGKVRERLIELIKEVCERKQWDIIALEVMPGHLHIFLGASPNDSVETIVRYLKGYTSFRLRQEFPHLARMKSLWTRSYFVSTASNASGVTIERYIAEQRKHD